MPQPRPGARRWVIRIHPTVRGATRFDTLGIVARHLAAEATVPVGLSLDHGETLGDTVDAIRAGCTAVMLDGAEMSLDDNIRAVARGGWLPPSRWA